MANCQFCGNKNCNEECLFTDIPKLSSKPEEVKSITGLDLDLHDLENEDGNAYVIMSYAKTRLQAAHQVGKYWDQYFMEATGGGYPHLLETTMKYFDITEKGKEWIETYLSSQMQN